VSDRSPAEKSLPQLERGTDLSRIVAFTDGVFAIAITLLVLQIDVPADASSASDLLDKLADQSPDFTAFWISFIVIDSFWISNHRFMRTVREYDRGLMFLTLPYLGFMVLIPFTSQLMGEYSGDFNVVVLFYVLNMAAMAGMAFFIDSHVLRRGLAKPEYEWDVELTRKSSLFTTLVFIATAPLVFVFGPWTPLLWLGLKWDPFQRRRDRAYGLPAIGSITGARRSKSERAGGDRSLADGDRGEAVDDSPPSE